MENERAVVLVQFGDKKAGNSGQEYSYFTLESLEVGDMVCVDTTHNYALGVVTNTTGLTQSQIDRAEKFVVAKIDTEEHEKRMEVQKQIQEIRNTAKKELEKINEFALLSQFYGKNEKVTSLLDNLAKLDPSYQGLLPEPKDADKPATLPAAN